MTEVDQAAGAVRRGELVIFPTETVYGLGANASLAEAVLQIYAVKGRPRTSPLIVHGPDTEAVKRWCTAWPETAQRLADRFWPGPLTLVLPKAPEIVDEATAGLKTVGLRVPAHPLALDFLRRAGVPVAAPSANPFTKLSPTRLDHVRPVFEGRVRWMLDGGPSSVGIESTVLSLVGDRPRLLRPGMISRPLMEAVIGPIDTTESGDAAGPHASPGLHASHYQPKTRVLLFQRGAPLALPGRGIALRLSASAPIPSVAMPGDPAAYAKDLYATLHEVDAEGWDWIAIEWPPETREWDGIRDRLSKAAATPA